MITIQTRDLRPGDFIPAARATVAAVDCFASVVIVDFTDNTATAPLPAGLMVEIERGDV